MTFIDSMTAMQAAAFWSGLLILWLVVLSFRTIFTRRRLRVSLGDGGLPEMSTAARVFGNASEYIPPLLIGLVLMASLGLPGLWVHIAGATMLVGRLLHAWGLSQARQPAIGRLSGMILTQLSLIGTAGALIACALGCVRL